VRDPFRHFAEITEVSVEGLLRGDPLEQRRLDVERQLEPFTPF
jgi:hypothetical protein